MSNMSKIIELYTSLAVRVKDGWRNALEGQSDGELAGKFVRGVGISVILLVVTFYMGIPYDIFSTMPMAPLYAPFLYGSIGYLAVVAYRSFDVKDRTLRCVLTLLFSICAVYGSMVWFVSQYSAPVFGIGDIISRYKTIAANRSALGFSGGGLAFWYVIEVLIIFMVSAFGGIGINAGTYCEYCHRWWRGNDIRDVLLSTENALRLCNHILEGKDFRELDLPLSTTEVSRIKIFYCKQCRIGRMLVLRLPAENEAKERQSDEVVMPLRILTSQQLDAMIEFLGSGSHYLKPLTSDIGLFMLAHSHWS